MKIKLKFSASCLVVALLSAVLIFPQRSRAEASYPDNTFGGQGLTGDGIASFQSIYEKEETHHSDYAGTEPFQIISHNLLSSEYGSYQPFNEPEQSEMSIQLRAAPGGGGNAIGEYLPAGNNLFVLLSLCAAYTVCITIKRKREAHEK